ncbi:MAG: M28 family peptidase [Bacteroidales bacterium]|nr:M28 family peptidase [Bacteroidales bacterium]
MKRLFLLIPIVFICFPGLSQSPDSLLIRKIFDNALNNRDAYNNLRQLCGETPGRLVGSDASIEALKIMKNYFEQMRADKVYLQEFTTDAWMCDSASVFLVSGTGKLKLLHCDALGPSSSTPEMGITAQVVEVHSLDEVKKLGKEALESKIVFYNRPWDNSFINTFYGYGNMVDQRGRGPALAAECGAAAVVVRSVTNSLDYYPHTGSTRFGEVKIPAVAISTLDADLLSKTLENDPGAKINLFVEAKDLKQITSYNLIAEITGTEFPDEYIVVGGHIDAWHNTQGAHDDGAGCVMSADVLRLFKDLNIRNKRTLRAVMFMDEELYQSGGVAYAESVKEKGEKHLFALESDGGAFTPRYFTVSANPEVVATLAKFQPLLHPYGIDEIKAGWGGVDIGPLKDQGIPLAGYGTDSQRYFDMHHSPNDSFDKINLRELQLGCGNMAAFIYLIDKYGIE